MDAAKKEHKKTDVLSAIERDITLCFKRRTTGHIIEITVTNSY